MHPVWTMNCGLGLNVYDIVGIDKKINSNVNIFKHERTLSSSWWLSVTRYSVSGSGNENFQHIQADQNKLGK